MWLTGGSSASNRSGPQDVTGCYTRMLHAAYRAAYPWAMASHRSSGTGCHRAMRSVAEALSHMSHMSPS
eukprot:1633633-Alexandrium_andersonii.AAC.1